MRWLRASAAAYVQYTWKETVGWWPERAVSGYCQSYKSILLYHSQKIWIRLGTHVVDTLSFLPAGSWFLFTDLHRAFGKDITFTARSYVSLQKKECIFFDALIYSLRVFFVEKFHKAGFAWWRRIRGDWKLQHEWNVDTLPWLKEDCITLTSLNIHR